MRLDDLPDYLTVDDVRRVLGLSKNSAYEAIKNGTIPCVRIGPRLTRVSKAALVEMMNGKGAHTPEDAR